MPKLKTTVLIILDGWGVASLKQKGNPITPQNAPHYFSWLKKFPNTTLEASGTAVGLFKGQEGNSEAGHLNIGAGRVVKQDDLYISEAIKDGTFFKNQAFHEALYHARKYKTAVHAMGLLSNHNSAHSCPEHLAALLQLFYEEGIPKVYLHLFTDGRDSGQHDAPTHLEKLRDFFHGTEQIATIMGRLYGMDRNKNWERTKLAYEAMVQGRGRQVASADEALTQAYNRGENDEFIEPAVIMHDGRPVATVKDNDAVFFFNLRSDRARQITKAFVQPDFEKANGGTFVRKQMPRNTRFVALTDFGPDLPGVFTAYPSRDVPNSLVQTLCPRKQLYIAESEKFAHITYFFNGGYVRHWCDEQWIKVDSDSVKNFVERPEMQAPQIADYVVKAVEMHRFEFVAVNFANADMLGHTGSVAAAERGVRAVDSALENIVVALARAGGQGIITADHGNVEQMVNSETGEIDSEHSVNPVPCIVLAPDERLKAWKLGSKKRLRGGGQLADVAPTILKMMGVRQPKEMTGRPLF